MSEEQSPLERQRILLIEDDPQIRGLLEKEIDSLGYDLSSVADGREGLELALNNDFALVLLDVGLPSLGGIEVCRMLKETKPTLPVIMVSARGAELDKVLSLRLGADDYVVKPFSVLELAARIEARLRNVRQIEADRTSPRKSVLRFESIEMDLVKRSIDKGGVPLTLTALEFDMLALLALNPGVAFSRQELLQQLWGVSSDVYDKSPTPIVTRLRRKIEDNPAQPRFILTVWSVGYKFSDDIVVTGS